MNRIDIGKILREKNPRFARFVPRFVVRWVENLVAARRHNEILDLYENRTPIGFIEGALDYIGVKYRVYGVENIPRDGRVLFAANHPLGGVDGMILAAAIEPFCPGVKLIVNDILLNIKPLRPIFVGVNKHGGQGEKFAQSMDELYNSDAAIINFPAGMCSRLHKGGQIYDLPWKKSFVQRCINSDRTVVPTYVKARNSKFFYRVERLRVAMGIKLNIGMLLLPREVFFQKGKIVEIYFGAPVTMDCSESGGKWCETIREKVYEMEH